MEASDRKQNPRMPEERGFLAQKKNSLFLSYYHCNGSDLFLSAASKVAHVLANTWVWRQSCLQQVVVSAKYTSLDKPTGHVNLKLLTPKMTNSKNEKELETLIHTASVYSQDIGIELAIEKYTVLVMKIGKRYLTDGRN